VLLLKEKHETRAYPASTPTQLEKSALAILRGRFEAGYYNPLPDPTPLPLDEAAARALPEGFVRSAALKEIDRWKVDQSEAAASRLFNRAVRAALLEKNGQRAWRLLQRRDGYEYEGVRLVELERSYSSVPWGTPERLDSEAP
jgi:hypothetical protein